MISTWPGTCILNRYSKYANVYFIPFWYILYLRSWIMLCSATNQLKNWTKCILNQKQNSILHHQVLKFYLIGSEYCYSSQTSNLVSTHYKLLYDRLKISDLDYLFTEYLLVVNIRQDTFLWLLCFALALMEKSPEHVILVSIMMEISL